MRSCRRASSCAEWRPSEREPVVAQRRPALEPLEQPLAVLLGVAHDLGHRALGREPREDRERVLGAIEPLLEQERALEREVAARRIAAAALLVLEEPGQSRRVGARAQRALEARARLVRFGRVREHVPVDRGGVFGAAQIVLQHRRAAQIERDRPRGRARRLRARRASRCSSSS